MLAVVRAWSYRKRRALSVTTRPGFRQERWQGVRSRRWDGDLERETIGYLSVAGTRASTG